MNPYLKPEDQVELDVRDLIRYFLKHWVVILLAGIICAGFFIGMKLTRSAEQPAQEAAELETEAEDAQAAYQAESELFDSSNKGLQDKMSKLNEYLNDSSLMKINAYDAPVSSVELTIQTKAEERTPASVIAHYFERDLLQGDYLNKLAKDLGFKKTSYLMELISVSTDSYMSDDMVNLLQAGSAADSSDDSSYVVGISADGDSAKKVNRYMVLISVFGETAEQAESIVNGMLDESVQLADKLSSDYSFTMTKGVIKNVSVVSKSVEDWQSNFLSKAATLNNYQTNVQNAIKTLQKPADPSAAMAGVSRKSLVKYGGVGFILGAGLLILLYLMKYLRNDKLISYKDLSRLFVLNDLGLFDGSEASADMVAANVHNVTGKVQKLLLAGTADQQLLEAVEKKLTASGLACAVKNGGNLLTDPSARLALSDAEAVVLVEKKNVSRYSDLEKETQVIANAGKPVLGVIIG